ncbi:HAL/PAL/TAL family ammonia-lyase [Nonomuraea sp. LPB2021202275-12-8]|uniref:HAL/PAL/TAL family ammonia-lyase n=1 Tax=Nonomuraea sp. LPB2021202275-12-8 TaxID=3120159 RepID=UPI00300C31C6
MATAAPGPGAVRLLLDGHHLTLEQARQAATEPRARTYGLTDEARAAMARSCKVKDHLLASGAAVYGVTTGFGDSSGRQIASRKAADLQRNLLRFLRVGTGPQAPDDVVRATLLIRANSLARGVSGIGEEPVRLLLALLESDLLPVIPERGSVGASGDLAPLAYIAATLLGEGHLRAGGQVSPAARALLEHGLRPVELQAKEALALVNGTSFMTAYAALAFAEAAELAWAAELCTALTAQVRHSPAGPFAPFPHRHKPHPGQIDSAAGIARLLHGSPSVGADQVGTPEAAHGYAELGLRVQDPYSVRCAPHVIGVLRDTLAWTRQWLTIEINSANDNPLFDPDSCHESGHGVVHYSGNFYGGHVAHAVQAITSAAASVADLIDRQLQLVVDEKYNCGLPANLMPPVAADHPAAGLHHGFKGAQIAASALTAEALHLTMPAGSFSRSTEAHNQDKVSMATIAARHARTAVQLATDVAAIHLLALAQAADLRGPEHLSSATRACHALLRDSSPPLNGDRPLDTDISAVACLIRTGTLRRATAPTSPPVP